MTFICDLFRRSRPAFGSAWTIGPIVNGVNYSKNMPLHPAREDGKSVFNFPLAPGELDYVTRTINKDISKASAITLKYEIVGNGEFITTENPDGTPRIALYFQREGDDWSAHGKYEHYRWYARTRPELKPGLHTYSLSLSGENWKSLRSSTGTIVPVLFRQAKQNCANVGFVFGGGGGAGHGVYLRSGQARFIIHDFKIG